MNKRDWRDRQDHILEASGVPNSVAHAMDCWVKFMKGGEVTRGYPKQSAVFAGGNITCFDDMDDAAENYAGQAVDGAMSALDHIGRTCIGIIWLGNTVYLRRIDVEQVVIEALPVIWRGLVARGVA